MQNIVRLLVLLFCAVSFPGLRAAESVNREVDTTKLTDLTKRTDITKLTTAQKGIIWDHAIHILGGNANVVSRWNSAVRVAVVSDRPNVQDYTLGILQEISQLTSLDVAAVTAEFASLTDYIQALKIAEPYQLYPCSKNENCANLVLVLTNTETMADVAQSVPLRDVYQKSLEAGNQGAANNVVCFFAPFQRASVIQQAMVFVRSDLPIEMIRTCLQEEIYQSFGLFNDFSDSEFFSFNNRVEEKHITLFDRALLQAVYEFPAGSPAFVITKRLMEILERHP